MLKKLLIVVGILIVFCPVALATDPTPPPPPPPTEEDVIGLDLIAKPQSIELNQTSELIATIQVKEGADPSNRPILFEIVDGPEDVVLSDTVQGRNVTVRTNDSGVAVVYLIAGNTPGNVTVKASFGVGTSNYHEDTVVVSIYTVIPIKPDLIVEDISVTPGQPIVNTNVTITVTVKNAGNADAGTFSVSLDVNGNPIESKFIEGLAPNESVDVTFVWTPTSAGNYTLAAQVDPENKVDELNEDNNEISKNVTVVELLGDVNGDGSVNVLDVIRVGQHFGESGEPGWIPEDLNKDGVINVLDIIIIGQNWTG